MSCRYQAGLCPATGQRGTFSSLVMLPRRTAVSGAAASVLGRAAGQDLPWHDEARLRFRRGPMVGLC